MVLKDIIDNLVPKYKVINIDCIEDGKITKSCTYVDEKIKSNTTKKKNICSLNDNVLSYKVTETNIDNLTANIEIKI